LPANPQEAFYDENVDYARGSPHLSHPKLTERLVEVLRARLLRLHASGLPLRVLEIGAGHGAFTETVLAAGCDVTAVDMSEPAVRELRRRFGTNPRFRAIHDPVGDLSSADDGYSLVLAVSVLHHIPDYVSFVDAAIERLAPGSAFLSLQDPLWYPRHRLAHRVDRMSYYIWRLGQGDLRQGLNTASRRLLGRYDESQAADMVEYHIVRQGVDELALREVLETRFESVDMLCYWSSQLKLAQRIGTKAGLANAFGFDAAGFRP
jgi:SAM-dependent methyltransferase